MCCMGFTQLLISRAIDTTGVISIVRFLYFLGLLKLYFDSVCLEFILYERMNESDQLRWFYLEQPTPNRGILDINSAK